MSTEYFVNKQDRYYLFKDFPEICEYYSDLVETISSFSRRMIPHSEVKNDIRNAFGRRTQLTGNPEVAIKDFLRKWAARYNIHNQSDKGENVYVVPLIQMSAHSIRHEGELLKKAFYFISQKVGIGREVKIYVSSAYFNLSPAFTEAIFTVPSHLSFITSCPETNPFRGSKGGSKYIPEMYLSLQKRLFDELDASGVTVPLLYHYTRPGWIWHAKGVWISSESGDKGKIPGMITIIGSSNHGKRSFDRDLESDLLLFTSDKNLKSSIQQVFMSYFCSLFLLAVI